MDIIAGAQGGQGLRALGRKYNLDDSQVRAAVEELAPAVMAGIRRETESPDSLSGLLGALSSGNHRRYLDAEDDGIVDDGNAILGHIFGSKDVSRGVAARASEASGIDAGTLKQMLPAVAAMVMGALGKGASSSLSGGGGLSDILGQVLGGAAGGGLGGMSQQARGGAPAGGGGLGDVLGQLFGGGAGGPPQQGGISDMLGSIFGEQAQPEVRQQATKKVGDALGDMLGRGTQRGTAADQLLDSVGHRKKTKLDR